MNDTWNHKAARVLVRPLLGTGVTPNHITTVRFVTGAASCLLLLELTPAHVLWSGVLWIVSGFLDRMDGELARIGDMRSRGGHLYDYYTDVLLNSAFFLCAGVGLRHGALGLLGPVLGAVGCAAMWLCCWWSEIYEGLRGPGVRTWEGAWGFQPDDALYLLAPMTWLGWLAPAVVLTAVCASAMAVVILARLIGLKRRLAREAAGADPGPGGALSAG